MSDKTPNGPVQQGLHQGLSEAKRAGEAAREVAAKAGQAGSDAAAQAKDVAYEAKDRVVSLAGEAKDAALSTVEAQKSRLADQVESLAESVQRSGEALEGEQDWVAKLVERGARELGGLADTLRTNDLQSLVGSLDGLARRQPALFLGASVVAGFALARVGKIAVSGTTGSMHGGGSGPNLPVPMNQTGMAGLNAGGAGAGAMKFGDTGATDVGAVPPSMSATTGGASSGGMAGLKTGTTAAPATGPVIKPSVTP